jgi:DNA-binding MarR family transcriptional regulator
MCLHARYDQGDRHTWPTLRLVKDANSVFGLASPRRVVDLVARLLEAGHLEQRFSPHDRRVRILAPTPKMIAQDQDWLVAHYVPLQVLFPHPGYAPIMRRDLAFHVQHRLAAASLLPLGAGIMERNPLILRFMRREAGMMVLIRLMHLAGSRADITRVISYSDIGARLGVSRTQVRKVAQEAEANGLLELTRRGAQFVRLTTKLMNAFDRFIADTMAGHDLVYELARRTARPCSGHGRDMD